MKDKQSDKPSQDILHRKWRLGGDEHSITTTEFEWAIMRFYSAFERSCQQLASVAGNTNRSFQELVILHVVAMQHHPQTSTSLARQLNRDDIANVQYILRKLLNEGLLVKKKEPRGKTYTYDITKSGSVMVERYAEMRALLLLEKTKFIDNIDTKLHAVNDLLSLLTGIYDDTARISATYSPMTLDEQ
ncbi:MAG TPA: transcriptional regulator [Gammaproteobacteria bacterium]|jgi:predicted MarR family transcription regulator|nr:transcriptional regulator [Gammaproteobacteria bacterium]